MLLLLALLLATKVETSNPLQIEPRSVIAEDDGAVLFSIKVDCKKETCPKQVELIGWDPKNPTKVKYRWQLVDDGGYGDLEANDQIYSRKAWFKETTPKVLQFSVGKDTPRVELTITPRPSMITMLKQIWIKLFGETKK